MGSDPPIGGLVLMRGCKDTAAVLARIPPRFKDGQTLMDSRVNNYGDACRVSNELGWRIALVVAVSALTACNGAPSRNILGAYFPSWMVCALAGLGVALLVRMLFRVTGLLDELPAPFVVMLSIACATTFALWLIWLA
jgi:hypothetical protein